MLGELGQNLHYPSKLYKQQIYLFAPTPQITQIGVHLDFRGMFPGLELVEALWW